LERLVREPARGRPTICDTWCSARLLLPLQRLLRQDLIWQASEAPGTDVADFY